MTAGAVQAQDPTVDELKARLEEQERKIEQLQRLLESGGVRPVNGPADEAATEKQVEKIVADYLKADAERKRQEEEKKKKEAEAQGFEVGKDTVFTTRFNHGVHFQTADGAFRAALRGRWQMDWGWATADPSVEPGLSPPGSLDDGVIFRRARLGIQGTIWEIADFVAEFDFANGNDIAFREVWMGVHDLPYIGSFRGGHFKEEFSLEQLTSSRYLTFIERSINDDAFVEAYNPGFMVWQTFADERIRAATGIWRSQQQNDNGSADIGDGEYVWAGRLSALPVWELNGRCLVHVGGAARIGEINQANLSGATTPGVESRNFRTRPYRIDPHAFVSTGNIFADLWDLYGVEAAIVRGPLSIQGEFFYSHLDDARTALVGGVPLGSVDFHGYYVFVSYFLTGEHRPYDRRFGVFTRPLVYEPFFLVEIGEDGCRGFCCGKGAWEVAARYAFLDLNNSGIRGGELHQYTLGLNWYWNPNMKIQWNYEYFEIEETAGATNGDVQTFVMRFAWDF
jgi:phosphate-selective porin OprO/OprP